MDIKRTVRADAVPETMRRPRLQSLTRVRHDNGLNGNPSGKRNGGVTSQLRIEDRHELLLEAARVEFAARGLEGARVDRIARLAGVNKQLIYHYYGSKDALYLAVLEDAYKRIADRFSKLRIDSGPTANRITKYVEFVFDVLKDDNEFLALVSDENNHKGRHVKGSRVIEKILSPLVKVLGEILSKARRDGSSVPDIDPVDLYLTIAGICSFYFTNINTLSAALGRQFATQRAIRQRRKHVIKFVLWALRLDEVA